ncbi:MAG: HAMP domain-containing protein [Lachnospiraceae bacterium]|nr:HAMP domain-containing protein [Lachnospiraceae bacterium]
MKRSIKTTFTLIFIAIVAALLLSMVFVNRFFLEDYYLNRRIHMLDVAYETIDRVIGIAGDNDQTIFDLIEEEYGQNMEDTPTIAIFRALNERSNIDIVMTDETGSEMAATSREGEWLAMKLRLYLAYRDVFAENTTVEIPAPARSGSGSSQANVSGTLGGTENSEGGEPTTIRTLRRNTNYETQIFYDRRSGSSYLECWGTFSDGKTNFLMSMPIASITEGAEISTRFSLITGAILLILGSIAVYFATGRMTKPINELAHLSERMSNLDFSARYEGRAQNEIGLLGESMNTMSGRLSETIDRLRDTNEQLQQANAQLQDDIHQKEQIDEMRRDFIANVSHELKTPIALIEGYAEGLVEGIADDKESRDYYCSVIVDESAKMNKMVRQLTSLVSYEYGGVQLERETFDLADLIRSVVASNRIKLDEADAKLTMHLESPAVVSADEFKIEEVFTNYMSNALHHLERGRRIIVRLKKDGLSVLRLSVYNDGEPIPEESLPQVWDKFYKVDKARTRAYGGSGIGLSIVKAIMEAHGGTYGVRNVEAGPYPDDAGPENAVWVDGGVEFHITIKTGEPDDLCAVDAL